MDLRGHTWAFYPHPDRLTFDLIQNVNKNHFLKLQIAFKSRNLHIYPPILRFSLVKSCEDIKYHCSIVFRSDLLSFSIKIQV